MNHWFDSKYSVAWFHSVVFWLGTAWLRFGSSHLSCLPSHCVSSVFLQTWSCSFSLITALHIVPRWRTGEYVWILCFYYIRLICVCCLSWLRTTIAVTGAFLDAFQKVADMATSTRGMQKTNTPTVTLAKHQIVFSLVGWDENQWEIREICVSGCLFHHVSEERKMYSFILFFSSEQCDLLVCFLFISKRWDHKETN